MSRLHASSAAIVLLTSISVVAAWWVTHSDRHDSLQLADMVHRSGGIATIFEGKVVEIDFRNGFPSDMSEFRGSVTRRSLESVIRCHITGGQVQQGDIDQILNAMNGLHVLSFTDVHFTQSVEIQCSSSAARIRQIDLVRCQSEAETPLKLDQCPTIRIVQCLDSDVGDDFVIRLSQLPHLEALSLYNAGVTDRSIAALESAKSLQFLCCRSALVSEEANSRLQGLRPSLRTCD